MSWGYQLLNDTMVFFHLVLTDDCNLCCRYCRGKAFMPGVSYTPGDMGINIDTELPADFMIAPDVLFGFLAADPDAVLTFYGGEPLLKPDLIQRIVNEAPVSRFMLQTNGTLLHRLDPDVIGKFETILVSIDGCEALTDRNRGEGTYGRIIANLHRVIANGYEGELIARMTVSEETDIFDSVTYLADNRDFSFSSIHWQMDANFWDDFRYRDFGRWVETSYNPGITRLAGEWVSRIENTGIVPKWYPFLDPMDDLLNSRDSRLRCGAGYMNYSIMTDGNIAPCPVMVGMKDYYLGTVAASDPNRLGSIEVSGRCRECDISSFCGGRCLYSSIVKPWSEEEADLVCSTVRHLFRVLLDAFPRVKELIADGTITREAFSHTKFNGCEIIP
ncbi:MAG TPA: TIGR04084 family radical SAM/SPASM domain-containing protein [Methanoregulaceae archaeon]|nr:TIGR04084 family radical SAM/SPASM domain-containing protein [Methanoregulaceae archaeon]